MSTRSQELGTMNAAHSLTYPTATPASLSPDARVVHAYYDRTSGSRVDLDVFDNEARRRGYVSREAAETFVPTPRFLTAVAELEAVGLASYSTEWKTIRVTGISKYYTVAKGRGSSLIEVRVATDARSEGVLLAVLLGADIETGSDSGGRSAWTLRARHENATDEEHDAASTAHLTVLHPTVESASYGIVTYQGVLTEAHLYPLGTDPLRVDGAEVEMCDGGSGCDGPHPYAPYLPPKVALTGPLFATFKAYPVRPYRVAADPFV